MSAGWERAELAGHALLRRGFEALARRSSGGATLSRLRAGWQWLRTRLPEARATGSLLDLARLCLLLGLRVPGFRLYLRAHRREPGDAAICREIAGAFPGQLDDAELASDWLQRAFELEPDDGLLGQIETLRGRTGQAERASALLEQATLLEPPIGPRACSRLARRARARNDDAQAERWWRAAAAQGGGAGPLVEIGLLRRDRQGDARSALRWFERAAAQAPANPSPARLRGETAYYYLEDPEDAVAWLERAVWRGDARSGFLAAAISWYHHQDRRRARRLLAAAQTCAELGTLEPQLPAALLAEVLDAPAAAEAWYARGWRERRAPACARGLARLAREPRQRERWLQQAAQAERQGLPAPAPARRPGRGRAATRVAPVLVISIPKAGTHLLGRLLGELGVRDSQALILPRHRIDRAGVPFSMARYYPVFCGQPSLPAASLEGVEAGEFALSHLPCTAELRRRLQEFKCIFLQRDLRACVASLLHHRTVLRRDEWALKQRLACPGGRPALLEFLIHHGRAERQFWQAISGWREQAGVFCLDFESLTGARGQARQQTVTASLVDFLGLPAADLPAVLRRTLAAATFTSAGSRSRWSEGWSPLVDELFARLGLAALNRALGYGSVSSETLRGAGSSRA